MLISAPKDSSPKQQRDKVIHSRLLSFPKGTISNRKFLQFTLIEKIQQFIWCFLENLK